MKKVFRRSRRSVLEYLTKQAEERSTRYGQINELFYDNQENAPEPPNSSQSKPKTETK